jgi:hypothetical protein
MAATVDDFIKRFGGGGTLDDREAQQYHDRFVSTQEDDRAFDNQAYHEGATEYLGKLPDDQFRQAARNAVAQVPPQQRQDLLGGLLNALGGAAAGGMASQGAGGGMAEGLGGLGNIAKMLGIGSTDPQNMSEDDAVKLMNYARKENPEALRQTVQEKPWFVKALGNPVVMGALTMAAAKLLSNRRS